MLKLILSRSDKLEKNFADSVKLSGKNSIVILSSKPYGLVKEKITSACREKNCLVLDTISSSTNDQVIYIPAENLTALSIAINQAQQSFNGKVTVLFDSITNLLIKNDISLIIKFFSFIISRSSEWGIDLVIVLPQEGVDEKLLSIIKQSADKIQKK